MTEVPNTILWIASIGLIIITVLMCLLLLAVLVLIRRTRKLVDKLYEIAEPLKGAAEKAGNTVDAYSSNLLRPLATVAGALAGFNKGVKTVGRKKKRRR
ncbi:MAG: hypothetical protein WD926_00905 [Patescibacteria group bacterium]